MATSAFFDPRGSQAGRPPPPRFQFDGRSGNYSYVIGVRDPSIGRFVPQHTAVPFGSKVILDFGSIEGGWLNWQPFDDSKLVPLPYDVPEAIRAVGASPGHGFSLVARLSVLLQQHGLAQMTCGGVILQNAVKRLRTIYHHAAEASQNMLPVVELRPSRQIALASRNGELHAAPELEIVAWVPRDDNVFGPRIVPPPVPILTGAEAAKLAASGTANDNPAPASTQLPWDEQPAQPVNDTASPAAAERPATPVQPTGAPVEQAANDAAQIANDVFAQMVPAEANNGRPNF